MRAKGVRNCPSIVGIEFEFRMLAAFTLSFDCCDKHMMYVCSNPDFVSTLSNAYGRFASLLLSLRHTQCKANAEILYPDDVVFVGDNERIAANNNSREDVHYNLC